MLEKVEKRQIYEQPPYPDVPYAEWRARINKARKLLKENDIGCLVLWGKENIRYFSGFQTIHSGLKSLQAAVSIIPAEGEAVLIVVEPMLGNAEGLGWTKDIRMYGVLRSHDLKAWDELPLDVASVVKELGYGNQKIGLEYGPLRDLFIPRPLEDIETLKNALSEATFVPGDKVIWGCRMIKSPLEVARIRKAVAGMTRIQSAVIEGFRPGMDEVDVMRIINHARADLEGTGWGDDTVFGVDFRCSNQRRRIIDAMAFEGAPITRSDSIHFNSATSYKGYYPDHCRVWQVGPITDKVKKAYELLWQAEDLAVAAIKPGVTPKDVYEAAYQPVREAGEFVVESCGHGIGLDGHEPPTLTPWNDSITLQEGMALSVEIWLPRIAGLPLLGIQDTAVVTEDGCEFIPSIDREIIQVSHPIL